MYPISLNLQGKKCIVFGAGKVAQRRVWGLLDADRSAGNGGKSVVFRKNIGNFRKIRGGIDMMCPVFSKK